MSVFVVHDLFRNTYAPLKAPAPVGWTYPGSCLTAQALCFPLHLLTELDVKYVWWRLTWRTGITSGTSATAVRLIAAENGPVNIREIAVIEHSSPNNPRNDGLNITLPVRDLIADAVTRGVSLNFIQQTKGNGIVGPQIFSNALEVVYA